MQMSRTIINCYSILYGNSQGAQCHVDKEDSLGYIYIIGMVYCLSELAVFVYDS